MISFWCVAAAACLPYLFVGYAKSSRAYIFEGHNRSPRDYADGLVGAQKRAYWAHLNGFEAFPPFAAAVIIAAMTNASISLVDNLAMAFVAFRLLHGIFYVLDWATVRSICWTGGVASVVGLFIAAGYASG